MANQYEHSLEAEVMSAAPLRLVQMLYRAALDATSTARTHLRAGEIMARSRQITKAQAILAELSASLDHVRGGIIAERLAGLYRYMQQRLAEANFQQTDQPLEETERLLTTLTEAWEACAPEPEHTQFHFAVTSTPSEHRSYSLVG